MGSDETISPRTTNPSKAEIDQQPLYDPSKEPKAAISPTCLLTTRRLQQTNSVELKSQDHCIEDVEADLPPSVVSAAITHAIQELERLLDEAVRIVELVDVPNDSRLGQVEAEQSNSHVHQNEAIPSKGTTYQEGASLKPPGLKSSGNDPFGGHISFSEDITSAVTKQNTDDVDDHTARIAETCRGSCHADGLQVLPPEPTVRSKISTDVSAHPRLQRSLAKRKPVGGRRFQRPDISPRTTSVDPKRERYQRRVEREGIPEIRLEGVDLKDKSSSESESLLEAENKYLQPRAGHERHFSHVFGINSRPQSARNVNSWQIPKCIVDLNGTRHVDLPENPEEINVHETYYPSPVARNWSRSRKRLAATVACINTACLGLILGIYSGEVPAIQYVIVDVDRVMIFGNVGLYCGLAISTLLFWPLPLLHGRKPYTVLALTVSLCLQIPQGLTVIAFRDPDLTRYRVFLLLSRAASGFVLGFVNINVFATLLDVFGASLQSSDPEDDIVDPYDVRRHGGGMGVWLAFWGWCSIGSIALGFVIGAFIISNSTVDWGFWVTLIIMMFVLMLNIIAPEVRRSAFRRTMKEILGDQGGFSRIGRGEVKMHLTGNGPYWWGEEVKAGLQLSWKMIKQPGFFMLALYSAWVYAQFTLVLMLLGALVSTQYRLHPLKVGLCGLSLALGAALILPFQKASWFSRARYHPPRTDSMTFQKPAILKSHTARRTIFTVLLPAAAIRYSVTSRGPSLPVAVPCFLAGLVAMASNLAIAECYALTMQTFDTSDLQPGMTGRPAKRSILKQVDAQRTNFSCYPRVSAGVAVTQFLEFIFGAISTAICGQVERKYGAMRAAAIVASVLMVLTILFALVVVRWRSVQMIPAQHGRRQYRESGWEPIILGHPSGLTRKLSILELGRQSRWSEIRRRNHLSTGPTGF